MAKLTSNTSGNFRTYGLKTRESGRRRTGLYRFVAVLLFLILCGAFWLIWNGSTLLCLLIGLAKPSFVSLTEPE